MQRATPTLLSTTPEPDIVWLGDPACHEPILVGGKAAQLSRLASAYAVPAGFCLTANAYTSAVAQTGAERLPDALHDQLQHAWAALTGCPLRSAEPCGVVAVRSSAVDEDGLDASFAGQHASFLHLTAFEAVAGAVERCWASGSSEQALAYRRAHGLAVDDVRLAVLVQRQVQADVAAVVFSANPVSGARDEAVVTASWGLGESIVGGTTTPDTWTVGRDEQILEERIGGKERMTVPLPEGGTREVDVPRLLRSRACLEPAQVLEAAALARDLEARMGWPVDIECAWSAGQLLLLQCRPITTLRELRTADAVAD